MKHYTWILHYSHSKIFVICTYGFKKIVSTLDSRAGGRPFDGQVAVGGRRISGRGHFADGQCLWTSRELFSYFWVVHGHWPSTNSEQWPSTSFETATSPRNYQTFGVFVMIWD